MIEDEADLVYLRPETAQGIFVNFKNVQQSTRKSCRLVLDKLVAYEMKLPGALPSVL